ncbi:NTF2-like domain [Cinara cedri]|uniref:NTF2-like domain n=1 Tax=Cinara cedri TaxID=506608 RepID=A0A5E4LYA8_9HEMI|nr:NTF2-like domain [Cinara cedri]
MEKSSGVVDSRRKIRALSAILKVAKKNLLSSTKYAAHIGYEFAELYNYVMRTTSEYANEFYDEHGEFLTVYEDESAIVVRSQLQVKRILMRPTSVSDYIVKSIISIPCGGSSGGLMVTVSGERFTQNFLLEYRPERLLSYAIVVSITQYIYEGPATYHQTPLTTFDSGDGQAITGTEESLNTSDLTELEYSISDIINLESDYATDNIREPVISSEITPIKEPDTAPENIELKPATDNKKIRKYLIHFVLFLAVCWAVYKYLKKMRSI